MVEVLLAVVLTGASDLGYEGISPGLEFGVSSTLTQSWRLVGEATAWKVDKRDGGDGSAAVLRLGLEHKSGFVSGPVARSLNVSRYEKLEPGWWIGWSRFLGPVGLQLGVERNEDDRAWLQIRSTERIWVGGRVECVETVGCSFSALFGATICW